MVSGSRVVSIHDWPWSLCSVRAAHERLNELLRGRPQQATIATRHMTNHGLASHVRRHVRKLLVTLLVLLLVAVWLVRDVLFGDWPQSLMLVLIIVAALSTVVGGVWLVLGILWPVGRANLKDGPTLKLQFVQAIGSLATSAALLL